MTQKIPKSISLFFSNLVLRNIYKVVYKYSQPKDHKHNRRYWPYYQVTRNQLGGIDQVYFKKKLIADNTNIPITAFKKCMLIATGPSLKDYPPSTFNQHDIDYVGINGAISFSNIDFKYYVIIDFNFTQNRFDLVLKVLQSQCTFFTTPRCLDIILRKIKPEQIQCQIKVIETITEEVEVERFLGPRVAINTQQDHFYLKDDKGFSKNLDDAIFDYFTVAYVALQIIYSLSYQEVYLAGLDMNNFNQPRFYENINDKQPTMLDQYLTEIFPAFDTAAIFLKQQDIKVYNLSSQSAIKSFTSLDPAQL